MPKKKIEEPEGPAEGQVTERSWPGDGRNPVTKEMNLWQKAAYVMSQAHRIPKTGYNRHFDYSYVTEADLTDHLRPLMAEAGLILLFDLMADETYTVRGRGGDNTIRQVTMKYTLRDVDNGEQFHEFLLKAEGQDNVDKGFYKAYTGANKYALLKLFQISSGDDPEEASEADQREVVAERRRDVEERRGNRPTVSAADHEKRTRPPAEATASAKGTGDAKTTAEPEKQPDADTGAERSAPRTTDKPSDNTPVSPVTLALLEKMVEDEDVPQARRKQAKAYMARHVSDLTETNARILIKQLESFKQEVLNAGPPEEREE